MAQTTCYVFPVDAQWTVRLNEKQFGPYTRRDAALDIAIQAARLAATHNPDGAEVRIAENKADTWHSARSAWSTSRNA
jgi:hypothetical protein